MLIQSTSNVHTNKVKMVLYGASGSGKTSAIKTLPHEKTLVISAESGLLALSGTKIDYVDIATDDEGKVLLPEKRIARLDQIFTYLNTKEAQAKYDNIVVDSLTEIGEVIATYYKTKITDKAQTFALWGFIGNDQIKYIKQFRDLPWYNVILIALEELDRDDTSKRFYGPDLPGNSAKQFLTPAHDLVCRIVVEADGKRYIQTQPLATVKAKDRSNKLNAQEPVDLGLIFNKISGMKKEDEKK